MPPLLMICPPPPLCRAGVSVWVSVRDALGGAVWLAVGFALSVWGIGSPGEFWRVWAA